VLHHGSTPKPAYIIFRARVLYTLGTSFLLPPAAVELLTESLNLHRLASTLTNSPLLQMDVGFNLAQTATSLADMLEELEGDSRKSDVRALRVGKREMMRLLRRLPRRWEMVEDMRRRQCSRRL
jgi:hypothetical protein